MNYTGSSHVLFRAKSGVDDIVLVANVEMMYFLCARPFASSVSELSHLTSSNPFTKYRLLLV